MSNKNTPLILEEEDLIKMGTKNIEHAFIILEDILKNPTLLTHIPKGSTIVPLPEGDEWLLDVNQKATHRIDKLANRASIMEKKLGRHQVLVIIPKE